MARLVLALAALCALMGFTAPAFAEVRLERVVLVQRHGVRPPTVSNAELAKYSDRPWPAWPVGPGELTPHGAKVVALVGKTLRKAYVDAGLLPAHGCAGAGRIAVWADNADERTRHSGQVLAESLAPGCGAKASWSDAKPRDPIFGAPTDKACHADPADDRDAFAKAAGPDGSVTPEARKAIDRLQLILAPKACDGGAGVCLKSIEGPDKIEAGPGGTRFSGPTSPPSPWPRTSTWNTSRECRCRTSAGGGRAGPTSWPSCRPTSGSSTSCGSTPSRPPGGARPWPG
jgi:4-phytase/acid phosphatase